MKQRFGNASWYRLIDNVTVSGKTVTVSTELINHQRANWNLEQAEAICKAFLKSPLVRNASVYYDSASGGSTAGCHEK